MEREFQERSFRRKYFTSLIGLLILTILGVFLDPTTEGLGDSKDVLLK